MTIKDWMLRKVNTTERAGKRADGRSEIEGGERVPREPSLGADPAARGSARAPAYLGPYAILIDAIRDELERFAESALRLHLAIAERDRYLLTAIAVTCEGGDEQRELLRRFVAEFKPEQIKRYLARELIAGLRNASAIDLSQFAGLDTTPARAGDQRDEYADLLADLNQGSGAGPTSAFRVALVGRWSASDRMIPAAGLAHLPGTERARTPIAGWPATLEIEDRAGRRFVEMPSVVPGRRYAIGKDSQCEVVVDGVFVSRRHCEIWMDEGRWWVADSGSTNGVRVESHDGRIAGAARPATAAGPIALDPGTRLVLSAEAHGDASDYPRIAFRAASTGDRNRQPVPATPIAPRRPRAAGWTITVRTASGVRTVPMAEQPLPIGIGRSRNQSVVIDWSHADVSGRHVEIVGVDDAGASVVVHGDNGVTVDGAHRAAGSRFEWKAGETMSLGRPDVAGGACTLTLARAP